MLKKIIFSLLLLLCTQIYASTSVLSVRTFYETNPVNASTAKTLSSALPCAVNKISVYDSSAQDMEVKFGSNTLIYPPGGGEFPLSISSGVQVNLIALNSAASTGESIISFFCN